MKNDFMAMRPQGGYKVILADIPWSFEGYSDKGDEKNPNQHYGCMSIDDICAMPVEALAAKDCVLFMWVTWPLMPEWTKIIDAWGFEYAGLGWEWIKYNPATDKYAFGLGYGTRKNLEPCIMVTRGNPSLKKSFADDLFGAGVEPEGVRSVRDFIHYHPHDCIRAPKREHSRKPDEQYQRIETMFDGPYVELFARQAWPGWRAWGNQVDKFDVKEAAKRA